MTHIARLFWLLAALTVSGLLVWSTQRYLEAREQGLEATERISQLNRRLMEVQMAAREGAAFQKQLKQVEAFQTEAEKQHLKEDQWIRYETSLVEGSVDGPQLMAYLKAFDNHENYYFQPQSLTLTGGDFQSPANPKSTPANTPSAEVTLSFKGAFFVRKQP
ncbi:MAG: hypothetical protein HQL52_12665 [Magnetococcales bacterium]|nr:hypothetical protein [Magnetococcales bacterium]